MIGHQDKKEELLKLVLMLTVCHVQHWPLTVNSVISQLVIYQEPAALHVTLKNMAIIYFNANPVTVLANPV